jgi:oligopeptidase B
MMRLLAALLLLPLALVTSQLRGQELITAPAAKKVPRELKIHGDTIIDNYFWLREKKNPDVVAHLEAENAYTATATKNLKSFEDKLYKEFLARIKQTDLTVPVKERGYVYFNRTEEGKQYPIQCRKKDAPDASEEVLLDGNELVKGKKFLAMGGWHVSDDSQLLAYTSDYSAFREYFLSVKDLRTGKLIEDRKRQTTNFAWAADNKTLFYVADDHAKRPYRLYRHVIGTDQDELIYEEKDELYRLSIERSHDRKYLFAVSNSFNTSEQRYLPADTPQGEFRVILPREDEHEYDVDHRDGLFYIRTNKGAKNFRLVTAPVDDPTKWQDLIPHRPAVMLSGTMLFKDYLVLSEREDGLPHVAVRDFATGETHRISVPEPVYSMSPAANPEFDTATLRFRYNSLVTPASIFDYDMKTRERKLLKQEEVLGGYEPSKYRSERIFATAKDGTKIPISLVYRKDVTRDGKAPLWLSGYGSYGAPTFVGFSTLNLSKLDRGVIFAQAHIRGGGDMGEEWHDAGKLFNKKNTFTDFIACADHLVAERYTSRDRMAIQGGSAGGLLIGATLNLRPDLCKAALLNVPFVDVINTMLDPTLPLTVPEYLEWGNPNNSADYEYMKSYCPYCNLAAKDYPSILVTTSFNDSQVMYWEPAKYVAKLRTLKTDKNPLLFKCNMAGGHGGSSGRYDALRERAFEHAWMFDQLGIRE